MKENESFEIKLDKEYFKLRDVIMTNPDVSLEVLDNPVKTHWIYDVIYYLTLGFYNKRGYVYKVKVNYFNAIS
jgi:hypothetical protein